MILAHTLGLSAQCAIADTAAGAQAFSVAHSGFICPPGDERARLHELPLSFLLHLEGLQPWNKPSTVDNIITFFLTLGFKTAGDLSRFTAASIHERWGETGALLWRRLNAQDRQPISPLLPTEPLEDYVHLDFPVSLASLLLHQLQKSLDFLLARLQGRRLFASQLVVTLHCEYSKARHQIKIEPNTPSRDANLFATLLENKLSNVSLENPIRDFEVQVTTCPEKSRQLDFFEPRTNSYDKLLSLFSLLTQSNVESGFFQIRPSIRPENGWQIKNIDDDSGINSDSVAGTPSLSEYSETQITPHHLRTRRSGHLTLVAEPLGSVPLVDKHNSKNAGAHATTKEGPNTVVAIAPEPSYGEHVMMSPRPTRLLKEPIFLTVEELQDLKILSSNPIERIEDGWWENRELAMNRDYYFAVSNDGQCLWIYQDLQTEEYYLHGFFD